MTQTIMCKLSDEAQFSGLLGQKAEMICNQTFWHCFQKNRGTFLQEKTGSTSFLKRGLPLSLVYVNFLALSPKKQG